ncbi:MAG: ketoacyl-ACP synthase III [Cytophagales bacterium]|nr:ketoacyl-ACP synthase III [Cytophagales bacterium]
MNKIRASITGVNAWVPDYILNNQEMETIVDTSDEWIVSRTGVKERRILKGENMGTSVMANKAVTGLFEKTNTKPEDIDFLICATTTPDMVFPATANIICDQVGAKNAGGFDVQAACSGFINALSTATQFIETGRYKKIIVVGADKMSSITNYQDRTTCILFGDAAGAVLLEPDSDGFGIYDFILKSDGAGVPSLHQKSGGSRRPSSHETVDAREHFVYQDGRAVFKFAVKRMADVCDEIMKKNDLSADDIAFLVPHQANKRIIDAAADRMGLGPDKVMINIQKYGNTTNATIPLCLWEWESKLHKGDNIIISAFGGGFTWGAIYAKWGYDT